MTGNWSSLDGKTAVVTGGGKGIGQRIGTQLAARGATVVLIDQHPAAEGTAGFDFRTCDVADRPAIQAVIAQISQDRGGIDILVNNAGMDRVSPDTWDLEPDTWSRILDVNLNGAWWATSAAVPAMIDNGGGRIVFIGSNAARLGGFGIGHSPAYSAAKAALSGLVVALSSQLEGKGILVNAISAGPTGTTGTPPSDAEASAYCASHPLGFGTAAPIADAVDYLVSDSGTWISGTVMNVSGGEHRGI